MVVCASVEELHGRVDASQLTPELGGYLFYSHQEWVDTRVVGSLSLFAPVEITKRVDVGPVWVL